jgi:hypothetical protein
MKEKIQKWFNQGLWSVDMVRNAVGKTFSGVPFTEEDFKEITGEEY